MANPHFLLSVPTLNAAATLDRTLASIEQQTYREFSCNIVDGHSQDETAQIAERRGVPVKTYDGKLLGARYTGVAGERYDYALLVDSDQLLERTMLERLAGLLSNGSADMVILDERSYQPQTWVERMFDLDRRIVHRTRNLSPESGVLMPRVFSKRLLDDTFAVIREKLTPESFASVLAADHAILYYEAANLSNGLAVLDQALFHLEPRTLRDVFHHFQRWGQSDRREVVTVYGSLLEQKMKGRRRDLLRSFDRDSLKTLPLLATKFVGYQYGYRVKK
jgi:glycosyltransferase involved in cell wall biosynthesis